jgi:hypothetical protein
MADLNDMNKPDGTSNYSSEVLQTLRGHVSRIWLGDYTGMSNLVTGMRRWIYSSGGVQLKQRNSGGGEDLLFDSNDKISKTTTNDQHIVSRVMFDNGGGLTDWTLGSNNNGGALELRGDGITSNRGWRLGLKGAGATTMVPTLTYLESEGIVKVLSPTTFSYNVGIGTSSPAYPLDVSGSARVGNASTSNSLLIQGVNTGTAGGSSVIVQNGALSIAGLGNYSNLVGGAYDSTATLYASTNLRFYTGTALHATLDTNGNLGIALTPSAWSGSQALEIGALGNSIFNLSGSMNIGQNAYFDGSSYRYARSGVAPSLYQQAGGIHNWYSATAGTAGGALTFVQAMTLDASSNLTATGTVTATNLFGQSQTWQSLTGSRAINTTYTNTTGRPIFVSITGGSNGTLTHTLTINSVAAQIAATNPNATTAWLCGVVPIGGTYSVSNTFTMNNWSEYR